jgi:hypothetical protein
VKVISKDFKHTAEAELNPARFAATLNIECLDNSLLSAVNIAE